MIKVSVIGSGTWGTSLAIQLAKNGHDVYLWSTFQSEIDALTASRTHPNLPGAVIPESIHLTTDLEETIRDASILVVAVPSIFTRETETRMKPFVKEGQIVINVAKGIEEDTLCTLNDITREILPQANAAVLSGPTHAEEVSREIPTAIVAGAGDRETAEFIQKVFMRECFRVYTSSDILGMEVGGALKNVMALAAGMIDGLGYGDNTCAALITRGTAELARLGKAMGCDMRTLYGLAGLGDLIVTCQSRHSRNRTCGSLMGQGYTMEEAVKKVGQTVEGIFSAKAAKQLSEKYGVEMPIINEVNHVLFDGKTVRDALNELMIRERKDEFSRMGWN